MNKQTNGNLPLHSIIARRYEALRMQAVDFGSIYVILDMLLPYYVRTIEHEYQTLTEFDNDVAAYKTLRNVFRSEKPHKSLQRYFNNEELAKLQKVFNDDLRPYYALLQAKHCTSDMNFNAKVAQFEAIVAFFAPLPS